MSEDLIVRVEPNDDLDYVVMEREVDAIVGRYMNGPLTGGPEVKRRRIERMASFYGLRAVEALYAIGRRTEVSLREAFEDVIRIGWEKCEKHFEAHVRRVRDRKAVDE